MVTLLMTLVLPPAAFGVFALLALRFGAESRPYFDERPVHDERPNWFPIAGRPLPTVADDDEPPPDGEPVAVAQRSRRAPTSPRSALTSPSGV